MQSSETGQRGAAVPQSSSAFGDGAFVQPGGDSVSLPLPLCFLNGTGQKQGHPPACSGATWAVQQQRGTEVRNREAGSRMVWGRSPSGGWIRSRPMRADARVGVRRCQRLRADQEPAARATGDGTTVG